MLLEKERQEIVKYGKKLIQSGLTKGTGGNLSIYNRQEELMAISPYDMSYYEVQAENVIVMDLKGNQVEGEGKPCEAYEMHKIFYEKRRDINAIVHVHSVYATTLSCLNWELPPIHYLVAYAGKNVRTSRYASLGTLKLAENAFEAMKDRRAAFLANHGLLTGGLSLSNAFSIAEEIEFCSEIYYRTKSIGEPLILSDKEMQLMEEKFNTYVPK